MDRLGSDIQIIPAMTTLTAEQLARPFFDRQYCKNGLPLNIISDHNKLFMSKFDLKASTAYHPSGKSEKNLERLNLGLACLMLAHQENDAPLKMSEAYLSLLKSLSPL